MSADATRDRVDQLVVDFPTATRLRPTVRFASSETETVLPIRSTLTMIRHKDELWYSRTDIATMRIQRTLDVTALRRTLFAPSEDFDDGGVHVSVSQVVGLEAVLNPTEARSK